MVQERIQTDHSESVRMVLIREIHARGVEAPPVAGAVPGVMRTERTASKSRSCGLYAVRFNV
jgi:hypothetical protein